MTWQPIESAPRDGRAVLISNGRYRLIAHWDDDASHGREEASGPAWQVFDCEDQWYSIAVTDPTHWQPLEPPTSAAPESLTQG